MDAELSLNANASHGFHGMDVNKKAVVDHSELDSGYVSNWSISQSHAGASTSALSNSAKFSSFKKSIDLDPIAEDKVLKDAQETPTTRSIRSLSAFHINTPQNARNHLETTPVKTNYFSSQYGSASRSNSKRNRSQNSIRWSNSPQHASPLHKRKSFSSRTPLFGSIDENYENVFSGEDANACNQSIGVSPIKPHNFSNVVVQPMGKPHRIQRHASGIESSTPKTNFRRTRTQSIVKPKHSLVDEVNRNCLMRKTQSFSPSRRAALRENNQHRTESNEIIPKTDEQPVDNPARKVLAFSVHKFDQLVQAKPAVFQTPTKSSAREIDNNGTARSANAPAKGRSRLIQEFSRKKTMKAATFTPTKSFSTLNESDILAAMADDNETESLAANVTDDNLMDISDSAITTPSTNAHVIRSDTPMRNDYVKQNVREEANRTPTKRFEKSTSYNVIPVKSSPEKEKFSIIYSHLPCTPPKNYERRPQKRVASAIESPFPAAPSAKRKLYEILSRPIYYNGIEKIDIITHLKQHELTNYVEKIFADLPDEALQNASSVCQSWKALIDGNRKLNKRRCQYVKKMQAAKENFYRSDIKQVKPTYNNNHIIPLHVHNQNYADERKHNVLAVSPSTQRFNEHQMILRNLKPEQRVVHCPICSGTSIVQPSTVNEIKSTRKSPRRPTQHVFIFQDRSLKSGLSAKLKRNAALTKIVSEYAVCKVCHFEFCTNCSGNRHPSGKCTKRPLGSSPKSDEDSPYKIEHSRTKRDLRRLGRLNF